MGRDFPQGILKLSLESGLEKFAGEIQTAVAGGLGELVCAMKGDAGGGRLKALEAVERGMAGDRRDCVLAGLWVLDGDLDRAHRLCQDVGTVWGAAWHGVVHRMEGDYWNSKYWWRRAGAVRWDREGSMEALREIVARAPVAGEVKEMAEQYEPGRFVDLVEGHHADAAWRDMLVAVQRWEWLGLFAATLAGK